MKIALFGDIHGYYEHGRYSAREVFQKVVAGLEVDLMLQVGDMCYYSSLPRPVYWIYGNNDSVHTFHQIGEGRSPLKNLIPIKTGQVLSFRDGQEIVRISGLNGAYDPFLYPLSQEVLVEEWQKAYFTKSELESCLGLKGLDIFLVHGCPSGLGICWQGREVGDDPIRLLLDEIRPRFLVCGHTHVYQDLEYGEGSRVISLAEFKQEYYILDTLSGEIRRVPTLDSIEGADLG